MTGCLGLPFSIRTHDPCRVAIVLRSRFRSVVLTVIGAATGLGQSLCSGHGEGGWCLGVISDVTKEMMIYRDIW